MWITDLRDLAQKADAELIANPDLAVDLEKIAAGLFLAVLHKAPQTPRGMFDAIPILTRLRLTLRDQTDLAAVRAPVAGKVDFETLADAADMAEVEYLATGTPMPAFLSRILELAKALGAPRTTNSPPELHPMATNEA